ncbi:hypothetical protein DUNSADRAFT_16589 [Dunaliella salina]|uniref:Ferric oxidoreductase domain-containing protein n=1 Tax=Dunaliella salina TaxID=3046 RepID=A0ABQ7H0X2_DUNSA|nr:hypothetical protein DUNSADRAFT_16589 [Dunaliella salina]|eukprot:KAF5840498.1 hypothetical protein DUNSADRAFT_16589 [Dunaliella salina]
MVPSHGHEGHGGESSLGENTVLQVWAAVFVAVCFSVLLEAGRRRARAGLNCMRARTHVRRIMLQALWMKVRYMLSYPLPPRSMWAWGAGGAVSVLDALVMVAWAAMAYTCLYLKLQARLSPAASPDKQMKVYAKAIGTATRAQLALALLPVPRSNFLAWLLPEAEFSTLIKYHRWMSWGLLYTYCLHGAAYSYVWLGGAGILAALTKTVNLWGVIALLMGLTISLTSCAWMRRSSYQWFYRIHVIGAPLFLAALFIHDRTSALYVVPAMLLVVVDRVHRTWADLVNRTGVSIAQGSLAVEGGIITMKLPWNKIALLHGTETLYLTAPTLSSNPHPFSVADVVPQSHSEAEGHSSLGHQESPGQIATIHAKVSGGWTSGLRAHVLLKPNEPLLLKVEGPYESSLRGLPHSPVIVMVAGGIGITPLLALLRRWNREHAQAAAEAWRAPEHTSCASPPLTLLGKSHPCTGDHNQLAHHQKVCHQQQGLEQDSRCSCSGPDGTLADENTMAGAQEGPGCCARDVESLCCGGNEEGGALQANASYGTDSFGMDRGSSSGSSSRSNSNWGSRGDAAGLSTSTSPPSPINNSSGHGRESPPSQVYLVFSCKSIDELRLLGPELLDAAHGPGADKWLHLYVSYTGFELEAAGKTCATCTEQGQECILRPTLLLPQPPSASKLNSTALGEAKVCKCNPCPRPSLVPDSPCTHCSCAADLNSLRHTDLSVSRGSLGGVDGCGHSVATASRGNALHCTALHSRCKHSHCKQHSVATGSHVQLERSLGAAGATGNVWLQPPPSRHLFLSFACACLAFGGAYLSLMQLAPFLLEYLAGGDWYGPVESGIVLFMLAVSGAAIPPALLLYVHHTLSRLCRWLRGVPRKVLIQSEEGLQLCKPNRSEQEPQQLLQCCVHGDDAIDQRPRQNATDGRDRAGLCVLPGYELDWDSKPQGKRIKLCRGRPQLMQLLRAVQQLHGNASKAHSSLSSRSDSDENSSDEPLIQPVPRCGLIPVLIGGPEPMWVSTQEACWQLNGLRVPAFLEPHRVAHQH